MASDLTRISFTEELLSKLQAFHCGDEPWEQEVSDWIKAPRGGGGAVDELDHGTQVWLYANEAGEIVGFGSLGPATVRWPRSKDPPVAASVIPMLGVAKRFHGQPSGPPADRYSARILDDLIATATAARDSRPVLVLYVFVNNPRAIRFYERAGFVELHKPYKDNLTGRMHKRMVLAL